MEMNNIGFKLIEYIPFIIVGVFVLILFYSRYKDKKRKEGINQLITECGFNFEDVNSLLNSFGGDISNGFFRGEEINLSKTSIDFFSKGHSRKANNIFSVPYNNGKIFFFDYKYTVGSGKNSTTYFLVASLFRSSNSIAPFRLRPENFFDKVTALVGYNDIDFEHRPLFSKKYYLKSNDEIGVRNLFNDMLIEFFESNLNFYAESNNNIMAIYKYSLLDTQNYLTFIDDVKNILTLMKVWISYKNLTKYLQSEK